MKEHAEHLQPGSGSSRACMEKCAGGVPSAFWTAIGRKYDLRVLRDAHLRGDQPTIGRLLGDPPCFIEFFREIWIQRGMVDTTWPMAARTTGAVFMSDRQT